MPKFRKKPVVIEAVQWTGNTVEIVNFCTHPDTVLDHRDGTVLIPTLEGAMTANMGDWIIKGVSGEFYPCKPDIFAATYEPVEEPTQEDEPTGPNVISGHRNRVGAWICPKSSCCAANVVYFDPDMGRYVHWTGIRETDRELFCGACNLLLAAAPPQDTEEPATEDTERCVWKGRTPGTVETGCGKTLYYNNWPMRCPCGRKPISVEDTQKEEKSDE